MKKMTKCLTGLTAAVLMFAFAGQAVAFCVHNMSDRTMQVDQASNKSFWRKAFSATLDPTEKACCHWSNLDCNNSGGQTDPVAFDVKDTETHVYICQEEIPANGDLYIYKVNGKYVCGQTMPVPPMPTPFPSPVLK